MEQKEKPLALKHMRTSLIKKLENEFEERISDSSSSELEIENIDDDIDSSQTLGVRANTLTKNR